MRARVRACVCARAVACALTPVCELASSVRVDGEAAVTGPCAIVRFLGRLWRSYPVTRANALLVDSALERLHDFLSLSESKGDAIVRLFSAKGFNAFRELCVTLELESPHLLTALLLDNGGAGHRGELTC